jgi:hypothetical protein
MNKICGMIADAIISGANPIPGAIEDRRFERDREIVTQGPRASVDKPRRMPARSRMPANEKTRGQFPGAGFEILAMLSMYRWFARRVKLFSRRVSQPPFDLKSPQPISRRGL